jgi:hypothetical protein
MSTPLHDGALLCMSAFTAACVSALMVENQVARIDWIKVLAIMGEVRAAEVNARRLGLCISWTLTDSIALTTRSAC